MHADEATLQILQPISSGVVLPAASMTLPIHTDVIFAGSGKVVQMGFDLYREISAV